MLGEPGGGGQEFRDPGEFGINREIPLAGDGTGGGEVTLDNVPDDGVCHLIFHWLWFQVE
ncbi:hypothetical protein [Thalassobaculum litoreum]|uniref:hypothetical protein n=1 Tax=Thalassobaculum litoreum TaxID=420996 RepID=UPI0011138D35|nr:hypothetical protein [Thalassobaculum litoreum]